MSEKFNRFRRIVMWVLIGIGAGTFLLIHFVNYNDLTGWQEPITQFMWVYLIAVFAYIILPNAVPIVWNRFKKEDIKE